MFLDFGVYFGKLVHIQQVPSGKTVLSCPYCNGQLIAKKGDVYTHHFAHLGESCRAVVSKADDHLALPFYNQFSLKIGSKDFVLLQKFHANPKMSYRELERLKAIGLVYFNRFSKGGEYQLTKVGKIPFGELPLASFAGIQDQLILQKHKEFEGYVVIDSPVLDSALVDLKIFRTQWGRVLSSDLYFIEITLDFGSFYKIGITTRDINDRLFEIREDLKAYCQVKSISVLRLLRHRGVVEPYFKHRYASHRKPIGYFTEYFDFSDRVRRQVLSDLTRLGSKELTSFEAGVVQGKRSAVEGEVVRRRHIKATMRKTAEKGGSIGRPKGSVESRETLLSKYPLVLEYLSQGLSLRRVAKLASVSVNTVRVVNEVIKSGKK